MISSEELILDTGDIILFRGSEWISKIIKCCSRSNYSHCGIIVKNPKTIGIPLDDGLYVLESNVPDIEDKTYKFGIQIHPLKAVIDRYDKNCVYTRHLTFNRNEEFYKNFLEVHTVLYNKPYNLNPIDWLATILLIDSKLLDTPGIRDTDSFWCSAMCSFVLCKLNLIQSEINWTLISPKELSSIEGTIINFTCEISPDTELF
jgi:hypothetical protein